MHESYSMKTLMTLDLGSNHITSLGAQHLAVNVQDNTVRLMMHSVILFTLCCSTKTLTKLILYRNNIGIVGAIYIAKVLQENNVVFDLCSFDPYAHLSFNADT